MLLHIVSEAEMTSLPSVTCHFIYNLLSAIPHILHIFFITILVIYLLNQTSFELVHFRLFHLDMQKLIFPSLFIFFPMYIVSSSNFCVLTGF